MEVVILPTAHDVGELAADRVLVALAARPDPVLGLATGSSPLGLYSSLARRVAEGQISLSGTRGFALDEYVGIPLDHPESYASVIRTTVVEPLGLNPAEVFVPDGRAEDLDGACADYERRIAAAGGIDVQILGIGENGHIGFNEPTSSFQSRTRVKTLAPSTVAANARFFENREEVPIHCLTQGLGTIMDARQIVLVATGQRKAAAIAAAVEGPVSSLWPASILQHHRRVAIIVDEEAAAELALSEYYRYTFANKPL